MQEISFTIFSSHKQLISSKSEAVFKVLAILIKEPEKSQLKSKSIIFELLICLLCLLKEGLWCQTRSIIHPLKQNFSEKKHFFGEGFLYVNKLWSGFRSISSGGSNCFQAKTYPLLVCRILQAYWINFSFNEIIKKGGFVKMNSRTWQIFLIKLFSFLFFYSLFSPVSISELVKEIFHITRHQHAQNPARNKTKMASLWISKIRFKKILSFDNKFLCDWAQSLMFWLLNLRTQWCSDLLLWQERAILAHFLQL